MNRCGPIVLCNGKVKLYQTKDIQNYFDEVKSALTYEVRFVRAMQSIGLGNLRLLTARVICERLENEEFAKFLALPPLVISFLEIAAAKEKELYKPKEVQTADESFKVGNDTYVFDFEGDEEDAYSQESTNDD